VRREPESPAAVLDDAADCAEDLAGVLASLLADARFAELGEAVRTLDQLRGPDRRRVLALCRAGSRLLQLDAVGFGEVEGVPEDLAAEVRRMQFPGSHAGGTRGSLDSLAPLYGLMLEAMGVHWSRGDTAHVVLILHLLAEYLPLLVWEPALGHAGDPERLREHVAGTLWGTPECPMPRHRRSAAERVLAMRPSPESGPVHPDQWRSYLDRWHARVSAALRQCALRPGDGRPSVGDAGCDRACGVVTVLAPDPLRDLATRMALAAGYADSPVVALRHSAPVGHFFGVPDADEVLAAWSETVQRLCRPWGGTGPFGGNPVGGVLEAVDDEPLPGLQALLSTVAGRPIGPTRVLERLRDEVAAVLVPLLEPSC
jgi:hypothetical protein